MTRSDVDLRFDYAIPTSTADQGGMSREITSLDDGRTIAWKQTGGGPDLLAIHGALVTLEDLWLGPVPALAEHFRVTAVDRPGHGHSARHRFVDASPWRQAAILRDFAQKIGLKRPILVGHSFGGAVALAYASLYPEDIAGLVLIAPICLPEMRLEMVLFGPRAVPHTGEPLARVLGATTDKAMLPLLWRAMYLPQQMPAAVEAEFPFALVARPDRMVVEGEDATHLMPGLLRLAMAYPSCKVPARFLAGTADTVVNNATQGLIAASLMPNAAFKWFNGMGHMLHHSRADDVVTATLSL